MASTSQCKYCGSTVSSSDEQCPNCGAPNEGYVVDTERQVFLPRTIEELKEYCAERGMPLLRMRFFIGEDYRKPKAFGIFKDGDDFVVYKNKANGQRAVRYRGPNEAFAVNELFQKLMDECRSRGIYPDGRIPEKPSSDTVWIRLKTSEYHDPGIHSNGRIHEKASSGTLMSRLKNAGIIPPLICILVMLLLSAVMAAYSLNQHRGDGYYGTGNGTVYYHYGDDWYYTNDTDNSGDWYETDTFPTSEYEEYSLGEDWDSDWGVSDFRSSSTWEEIQESDSNDSPDSPGYDTWDAGDTDWDTDW